MRKSVLLFYEWTVTLLTYFLLSASGQSEISEVTVVEGMPVTVECNYNNVQWTATIDGEELTVARCFDDRCSYDSRAIQENFLAVVHNNNSTAMARSHSNLTILSAWRSISEVHCNYNTIFTLVWRKWALNVIMRPSTPAKCEIPILKATNMEMFYVITITCSIELYQNAIFILEYKSPMDIYNRKIQYSFLQSHWTGLLTTTYEHRLYLYVKQWWNTRNDAFRVVAYPDIFQGRNYTVTTSWLPMFPKVEELITNFTLNGQSSDLTVGCNETVTIECEGQGELGLPLELFDTVPSNKLDVTRVPMVISFLFSASTCGLLHTFGCRVGAYEVYRHLTVNSRADSTNDKTKYILAASITLAIATLATVIVIFFCIRMRLRRKRPAQAGRPMPRDSRRPGAADAFPQPPPAYDDIYVTGASSDRGRPPVYSLALAPPPYSAQPWSMAADDPRETINEHVTCGVYEPISHVTERDTTHA